MRFFRFRRKKSPEDAVPLTSDDASTSFVDLNDTILTMSSQPSVDAVTAVTETKTSSPKKKVNVRTIVNRKSPGGRLCTIDKVPCLVDELASINGTSSERAARILRKLFDLSEHAAELEETRECMVRLEGGRLVVVLLRFVERASRGDEADGSQPQLYLALLLLNNISIPVENKRLIAIHYGGARVLCQLLTEDPSCHLSAIILVNLTFADAKLRRDLLANERLPDQSDIQLVESLGFAFLVASLSEEEYEQRQRVLEAIGKSNAERPVSPRERLAALLAVDKHSKPFILSGSCIFPDTARWCLAALQNLTRPCKGDVASTGAQAVVKSGIVPSLLRCITTRPLPQKPVADESLSSSSSGDTPVPAEPQPTLNKSAIHSAPLIWGPHTTQDAALYMILNLALQPSARDHLLQQDAVKVLSRIAYSHRHAESLSRQSVEVEELATFQCLKARMALAYLVGSEGHFGQPQRAADNPTAVHLPNDSVLLVNEAEAAQLVELLANTLHNRPKKGIAGYSSTQFRVKHVLMALRCLLTNHLNQIRLANTEGMMINSLLVKILVLYSLKQVAFIDSEAAEYAVFSLYLLSNQGFQTAFLPSYMGNEIDFTKSLAAKVLTAYIDADNLTAAGKHAATQLLLRLKYLYFNGTIADAVCPGGASPAASDFSLQGDLLKAVRGVVVPDGVKPGMEPSIDIFNRAVVRGQGPLKRNHRGLPIRHTFHSALHAVQDLSFGSTKFQHTDGIDDILIANNIADNCEGNKTESYGFEWNWEDEVGDPEEVLDSRCGASGAWSRALGLVGLAQLCGTDTTQQ